MAMIEHTLTSEEDAESQTGDLPARSASDGCSVNPSLALQAGEQSAVPDTTASTSFSPVVVGIVACAAALILHGFPILWPFLFDDDFAIIRGSWAWSDVKDNLWRPWNEHAMPLGRLSTWGLVQLAGDVTALPFVTVIQGPIAVVFGMWLVYWFVKRELGHCAYGLVAMILFGVTLKYNEAVFWFTASFTVLSLDTTLLALLSAQRWQQNGRSLGLAICVMWCALAPAWFAIGVLAGPLCSLYLFSRRNVAWLAPILGTSLFLAVSLSQNFQAIQHADHFDGQTATQAFQPIGAMLLTARIIVDNLILGVRAFGTVCPPILILPAISLLMMTAGWWLLIARRAGTSPHFIRLAIVLVVVPYVLVYSFRANWPYEEMMIRWTRYNLFPYLGFIFIVCAGLPSREGSLFCLHSPLLSGRQAIGLLALTGLLLVLQLPAIVSESRNRSAVHAEQMETLRRIVEMDRLCIRYGISSAVACEVLQRLDIPYSGDPNPRINGWELLRGSNAPQAISKSEARALLDP